MPISFKELYENNNNLLIFGTGDTCERFVLNLKGYGFITERVFIWDIAQVYPNGLHGYKTLTAPDFTAEELAKTITIIALEAAVLNELIGENFQEIFEGFGLKIVIHYSDIRWTVSTLTDGVFENKAYTDVSYQDDIDFSGQIPLVKSIAYYLPQFHEIPENNEWWGDGFTEWANTKKARPKFDGHYQPKEPHDDLGYYDLSDAETIRKQAQMARRHGIYGWCMYYYWFSGKKLLFKPFDLLLENKDIDINFCIMWCNETWTKSWVGVSSEELIKCDYKEDDAENFIDDLQKYIEDERYIRIAGKPLICIYKTDIPELGDFIRRLRKRAEDIGIGEIYILSALPAFFTSDEKTRQYFDGEYAFCPIFYSPDVNTILDKSNNCITRLARRQSQWIGDYKRIFEAGNHQAYLSCMCGWDNSPRYEKNFAVFDIDLSLRNFYDLVKYVTEEAKEHNKEFIFVFAWNEWAEGAYLEPDRRFGYAVLNTFSKAVCGIPVEKE
ncbi:MAG: glycoside hydrolase family 99-like domain-containing protein [Lachnospiraceae bacterium]|nr:glycoside hydrolase family 99-like domain-containing protein [Lachnospiraceae bacterium]